MVRKIKQFFIEVIAEVKKVTWSSKKELIGATIVVMIAIILTTIFIGVIDFILSRIMSLFM